PTQGRILLHYDHGGSPGFIGVQYVDVRLYQPDYTDQADIGFPISPTIVITNETNRPKPVVSRGVQVSPGPDFVYQHLTPGPMEGFVYPVRRTTSDKQIEVFW